MRNGPGDRRGRPRGQRAYPSRPSAWRASSFALYSRSEVALPSRIVITWVSAISTSSPLSLTRPCSRMTATTRSPASINSSMSTLRSSKAANPIGHQPRGTVGAPVGARIRKICARVPFEVGIDGVEVRAAGPIDDLETRTNPLHVLLRHPDPVSRRLGRGPAGRKRVCGRTGSRGRPAPSRSLRRSPTSGRGRCRPRPSRGTDRVRCHRRGSDCRSLRRVRIDRSSNCSSRFSTEALGPSHTTSSRQVRS